MSVQKKKFFLIASFCVIVSVFSYISAVLEKEMVCYALSALCSGSATAILTYSCVMSRRGRTAGYTFPFFALACLSWFVADILWLVTFARGGNPLSSEFTEFMYTLTNAFFCVAVLIYIFKKFRSWRSFQFLLDVLSIALLCAMVIWIAFFHKDSAWIGVLLQDGIFSVFCISSDFLIIVGVLIVINAIRKQIFPIHILLFGIGLFVFSMADIWYYYIHAFKMYTPTSLVDVVYVISLLIVALAGLWEALVGPNEAVDIKLNTGNGMGWFVLIMFPVIALFSQGFVFQDILHFAGVIIVYKMLSSQVQVAVAKDELYCKEKEINITLERRVNEQYGELVYLANHDTVTKLHNRRYFIRSLEDALEDMLAGESLAVFLMDIDRFKMINDTLGHDVGDKVLLEMSARMKEYSCDRAVVARLGGDEFALYVRGALSRERIATIAEEILDTCSRPIYVADNKLHITMSLGIAVYPKDSDNRVALMRNADIAMYRAKSQGYNKYAFYDPFLMESFEKKSEIEALLREADIEKDFELFYQPQFDLMVNRLIGAEALLRWKNDKHGYIPPKEFIPIAEEIDYIIKLGKWVMNEAVKQIIQWNTAYSIDLKMGINISPKQLQEDDFVNYMRSLINNENFRAVWLDAEITENILLEADNKTSAIFELLKDLNVTVSVDDFGSGYSSWGYLNKFPFDRIKIDQSLIDQLSWNNTNSIEIVRAIISLADAIGIRVIAEGVETEEQLDILRKLKCRQAQGFFLGRPVPPAEFENMFIRNSKIIGF